jgi:hypothetical protein
MSENSNLEEEKLVLEQRKVKALEKIANSVDALTLWFEEVDKDEWGERLQYYLFEGFKMLKNTHGTDEEDN